MDEFALLKEDNPPSGSRARTVPRSTTREPSSVETILAPFKKSWSAMMLLVVICGLGYGSYQLANGVGSHVSAYVVASGENLDALLKASVDGANAHTALQQALSHVLASSIDTRDQVIINGEKLAELSRLLKETSDLMRTAPINQQAQMDALARIEKAVDELTRLLKEAPRMPPQKSATAP